MSLPVRVHFRQQFFLVSFCCCRYFLLHFLLQICAGFDVCPIYKYRRRGQCSRCSRLFQYPLKHQLYRFRSVPVLEVVAHRGKMGQLLTQRVSQKPPVCYICLRSAQRSPQRGIPIQMLQQYNFEQHHWVDAPPSLFFAVQRLHDLVQFLEIYRCIHLPQ